MLLFSIQPNDDSIALEVSMTSFSCPSAFFVNGAAELCLTMQLPRAFTSRPLPGIPRLLILRKLVAMVLPPPLWLLSVRPLPANVGT